MRLPASAALAFALTAARSLQAQVDRLLDARRAARPRRLLGHRSRRRATTSSRQLGASSTDGRPARGAPARSSSWSARGCRRRVRRVGESLGKGLDRDALLDIVVQTAVDGVGAECGRVVMRDDGDGPLSEAARAGDVAATWRRGAAPPRPRRWRAAGRPRRRSAGANALARPLHGARAGRRASSASCRSRGPGGRSPSASGSSSPTSPTRRRSRSRTSTCTRRCSARRSRTSSPACSTTAASRRS